MSGVIISAAAEGVGARRSETKSEIVTSVSWPIALTTGTLQANIDLATISSLKGQRSSRDPPPLAKIINSIFFWDSKAFIEFTIEEEESFPWTFVSAILIFIRGYLRFMIFNMSC